jgi:RNA polymerase sigma factor (sigma-70 family)
MEHHEIETWVTQAKKGSQEAITELFKQYKSYIFKSAYQFNIKSFDSNDLAQLGYLTILNAIKNYKPGSNTFSGYVIKAIKNTLFYTYRQNAKFEGILSLNYPLSDGQDSNDEYEACFGTEDNLEERVLNSQELIELKSALAKLPREEISLINTVYYHNDSLSNYARKSGLSYNQAVRKRDRILRNLNNRMKIN